MAFMNEGSTDRVIRVIAGIVLLALGWGEMVTGTLGSVAGADGACGNCCEPTGVTEVGVWHSVVP